MVSLKSIAISSVCVMSMFGMSTQQGYNVNTNIIDDVAFPLAFAKQCHQQSRITETLDTILKAYYQNRRRICPDRFLKNVNIEFKCTDDIVSLAASVIWPREFERQAAGYTKIKAQAECLNFFVNGD